MLLKPSLMLGSTTPRKATRSRARGCLRRPSSGAAFPDEVRKTIKLVAQGDKYTVTVGQAVDQGTLKLNPAATPKELDITYAREALKARA